MAGRRVIVKVPASTANLGPGFDSLGMALSLYAWVEMSASESTVIRLYGDHLEGVPTDKSNLIYDVAQSVFREAGVDIPELDIAMYSDIPLTRGLGSSASAVVGALVAANALIGSPLSQDKLFQMATALEGHPDNVGASLFGGIVVASWDGVRAEAVRLEAPSSLEAVVAIPSYRLSTEKARHALPSQIAMSDAVFNVASSSLLVAALASGRLELIRHAMRDRLHQPYRAPLIPGMPEILARACDFGALGVALSGAGPTMLALVQAGDPRIAELERFLRDVLEREGAACELMRLKPCAEGARVTLLEHDADYSTLEHWIRKEVEV
ncbi:homoserine kinase [Paenibacillus cisolokensis]|jgi:homoserine kinase|uniref:homoserine kinase n=1 Tax=Paenibacillus cisolokensis TaxID=1658519 RepID=UPI003D2A2991